MISKEEVKKLADLARLNISDSDADSFTKDFESIVAYVSDIQNVTDDKKIHNTPEHVNCMRDDDSPQAPGQYREKLLREMPETKEGYLKVKKIL